MKKSITVIIAILVVAVAGASIYYGVYTGAIKPPQTKNSDPLVFSNNRMLLELWTDYKNNKLEPGTNRTLDKTQNNLTTSEGESYTMMRAVWVDDRTTFDNSWKWTKNNLQRNDKLLSWRFGQKTDGSYGIQTDQGGQNTATDADVDVAYALIMASNRWKEDSYLYEAQAMIKSIWEKEVVQAGGQPVLASNDIERKNNESILINPSYFAPYAYRVFAKIDAKHDWNGLVDSSYDLLKKSSQQKLQSSSSSGLIPNWVRVDRKTGQLSKEPSKDTDYGYDAFRTPWRLALDYRFNGETRAKEQLARFSALSASWKQQHKLASVYRHDGTIAQNDDVPAANGANLGYFIVQNPDIAAQIYKQKLLTNYNPDTQGWKYELSYYDDNWAWFGMALYLNQLPNIAGEYDKA